MVHPMILKYILTLQIITATYANSDKTLMHMDILLMKEMFFVKHVLCSFIDL